MDKVKRILLSLPVIFISFFFMDESGSILLISNDIQVQLNHNLNIEPEVPHQHNFNRSDDDERLMNSDSFEISCPSGKLFLFSHYHKIRTEDYTGLIWQPPKSV